MRKAKERPNPVPSPGSLVVKKGSNTLSFMFGDIPAPSSVIVIHTQSASIIVCNKIVLLGGVASRALLIRFTSTWSKRCVSPKILVLGSHSIWNWISLLFLSSEINVLASSMHSRTEITSFS